RIALPARVLEKQPAAPLARLVDEPEVAHRRDGQAGEDLLVDGALRVNPGRRTLLGDDVGALRPAPLEPVDGPFPFLLQSDDRRRPRTGGAESRPGLHGRVSDQVGTREALGHTLSPPPGPAKARRCSSSARATVLTTLGSRSPRSHARL